MIIKLFVQPLKLLLVPTITSKNHTHKPHKLTTTDTGCVPYEIVFSLNKYYMICFNIDTSDGLVNGAVGKLVHVDYNTKNELIRVWLEFPESSKTEQQI